MNKNSCVQGFSEFVWCGVWAKVNQMLEYLQAARVSPKQCDLEDVGI